MQQTKKIKSDTTTDPDIFEDNRNKTDGRTTHIVKSKNATVEYRLQKDRK